jgi:hypothetical protein
MTTIENLEFRVAQLQKQMDGLLSTPGLTAAQKEAVTLGHKMTIDELQTRIDALKAGQPDPFE